VNTCSPGPRLLDCAPYHDPDPPLTGSPPVYIGNYMVTNNRQLDSIFGALSDATRRAILAELAHGERTVGELAEPFEISRPAISKHLRVLEQAGLVQRTPEGRISRCALDAAPLREAADWVGHYRDFWEERFDALARYLETPIPVDEEDEE